jgi:hypothetical protein
LYLERSVFNQCDSASIYIDNNSTAEIFTSKISNSNLEEIYLDNESKLKAQNTIFENCLSSIPAYSNSKANASDCVFNKMRACSASCYFSAFINLDACEVIDPGKGFCYIAYQGILKVNSSKMKQRNKLIPILNIEKGGEISLLKVKIEWNGVFNLSTAFGDAAFIELKDIILNQNRLFDYLFKKNGNNIIFEFKT